MADERRSVGVRVRPNSHDFIRQLRAQLAGKRFTYTVDVKANTKPATADVRTWANGELKKVHAVVNVGANMGKATRDVAQWRQRIRTQDAVDVKVGADMSKATRDVRVWREAMGNDLSIRVSAKVSGRGAEALRKQLMKDAVVGVDANVSKARSKIEDLANEPGLFDIEVDANTKKAKVKVREFFADVQGEQATLDLGADVSNAVKARDAFKAQTKQMTVSQQLDLDTKKARLELLNLRLQEKRKKLALDVDVKTEKLESFSDVLRDIEKRTGSLTVIRSLDLGPLTLGKPTGLVGTLATITTLAGLLPGLVTGLGAASDAIMRLAGAAAMAPGAIGALAASIGTLTFGTQGVGDAFGAMFDMWKEGASEQASSANNLVQAHNNYRNAVVDEGRAQEDVARARREALHDLRDLNNELRGGVLNEAQALLDLQKARDRLAAGGFKTQTEYLQAQLDVRKAEQSVAETREGNIGLQERANEANAKGVDGSDRVRDALEAQTRASQQTAQALAALTELQNSGTDATKKFNDMLGQLSPNARDFVETFAGLKGEIGDFRNAIQDTIFEGTGGAFSQMFERLMPSLQPGVQAIAEGLNQNLLQVFTELETGGPTGGKTIIERILGGTAETQKAITGLINPLITGLGTLTAAGAENLPTLINLLTQFMTRFSDFITTADQDGTLDKFMKEGIDALEDVVNIGINATKIMNDFSTAFRDAFGEDLLSMIARVTGEWHDYLSSAEGQSKINEYMDQAKEIWKQWQPILADLPELFGAVSEAAQSVLKILLPILEQVSGVIAEYPEIIEAFAVMWLSAKMLSAVKTIKELYGVFKSMYGVIKNILTALPEIAAKAAGINTNVIASQGPGGPGAVAAPGKPGAPGAPGVTPGIVNGKTGLGATLRSATATTAAITAPVIAIDTAIQGRAAQDARTAEIEPMNAKLPKEWKPITGAKSDITWLRALEEMAKTDPGVKWVLEAPADDANEVERTKRYLWLATAASNGSYNPAGFTPPPVGSYKSGGFTGYTDWGVTNGRTAELHGGEWVQPHQTVNHYGAAAMKAVQDRKATISFDTGGPNQVYDPRTGQWVTGGTVVSHGVNPAVQANPGGWLGTLAQGAAGAASAGASFASQGFNAVAGKMPGVGTGPAPGNPLMSGLLGGLGIPGVNPTGTQGPGWAGGTAPVGLGGGPDGFDIRNFGIGPGPPGSGPNDWLAFAGNELGSFGANMFKAFAQGALDMFGLGGITNSPYFQAATGIAGHIAESPGFQGATQGPGAGQTNADVSSLLATYDSMPSNPAYPGFAQMPGVIDPSTGSAVNRGGSEGGLQVNTLRGKRVIQANFPWATNIGGVRKDNLKWHPQGLALDVMTDPGLGNYQQTPEGVAKGNQLYAWLKANQEALGIDYIIWNTDEAGGHRNHLHVNFAPSGYPNGATPVSSSIPGLTTPVNGGQPSTPANRPGWGIGTKPGAKPAATAGATQNADIGGSLTQLLNQLPTSHYSGGMVPMANPNGPRFDPKYPGTDIEGWRAFPDRNGELRRLPTPWGTPGIGGQITLPGLHAGTGSGRSTENPWTSGGGPGTLPLPGQGGFGRIGDAIQRHKVMDRGGWIGPGTTIVHNYTGHPELVVPSYAAGGYYPVPAGVPTPRKPLPRVPDARPKITSTPPPQPQGPSSPGPTRAPAAPPPVAQTPPGAAALTPPTTGPAAPIQGPSAAQIAIGSMRPATGVGPSETGDHVHPALRKGITSGFATAGNLAATAISMGAAMGTGGMGGGGGGGAGQFVAGLFQQAGKIATNVANVASSFLVGNITGGTTANPYGVTQRGSIPSGGSRVVDNSSNQFGDIYTNNLDEYMKLKDRRDNQRAQSGLGSWGNR